MKKVNKVKELILIIVAFLGTMAGCIGVRAFNIYVLMSLPLVTRMVTMILFYWLIALVPVIIMAADKEKLENYGFRRDGILRQIVTGVLIGVGMSVVLTLVPHLLGYGNFVDNGHRYQFLWQFIFEFVYCTCGVALAEEFVFRGMLFEKLRRVGGNNAIAVICSSVLFGLFHIFNGNLIQVVMTTLIGLFFCFCRLKIRNCSVLSLIIAHGVYDAMITVWLFVFLR
jgi:membrane protease YdiL (CAAX protease family)